MTSEFTPEAIQSFSFVGYDYVLNNNELVCDLHYQLDEIALSEQVRFPNVGALTDPRHHALKQSLQLLHWVAGISYWKAACPTDIRFQNQTPDAWQTKFLRELYVHGLAEFAFENQLDIAALLQSLHSTVKPESVSVAECLNLSNAALVPLGGGKDSLVALEKLRGLATPITVTAVRPAWLIHQVAAETGLPWLPIDRYIDPQLLRLNQQGALNGHVPITAINMGILIVACIIYGHNAIVFANELSADTPTRLGQPGIDLSDGINHQYSKSSAFEGQVQAWIKRYIASDLLCFSILRPYTELGICQEFAKLQQYHQIFSSCNRQFHLDGARTDKRWCGTCPKCLFVFLALAPFMPPAELRKIFTANLLDRVDLVKGFGDLVGLGLKPFECVGTEEESRAALLALTNMPAWSDFVVVKRLSEALQDIESHSLHDFLGVQGDVSMIPVDYLQALDQCV